MAQVPTETVLFQEKSMDTNSITRLVDLILDIWTFVDNLEGTVAAEVKYLREERKKDLYEESDFGSSGIEMLLMATMTASSNEEASDKERLLRKVFREINYKPNLGAMNQVGLFLEDLLGTESRWRGDTTRSWILQSYQYEDLFRILVWMIREYEEIIKAFFARRPSDTNMLLYLENIRKSIFKEAKSLEGLSSERDAFHAMLGTGNYFVSPLLVTFWREIEYNYNKTKITTNPIDEGFVESARLTRVFDEIDLAIKSRIHATRSRVGDQLYLNRLNDRLNKLKRIWDSVFGTYFFLGPTATLLEKTRDFFSEVRPLLMSEKMKVADPVREYLESILEYLQKFESASNSLLVKLRESVEKFE
ncbi:MAG TPA: hypothetical protein PKA63_09640 [Oligoflexia bacterium]|nr:hypothetical protein [Oligoflexia bacterium]HMP48916.1 hypothetical protein [Oligoflexia bacterium]